MTTGRSLLFAVVASLAAIRSAMGVLTITISPIANDANSFQLAANGSLMGAPGDFGSLLLDGNAFAPFVPLNPLVGTSYPGLNFGGEEISAILLNQDAIEFDFENILPPAASYGFEGSTTIETTPQPFGFIFTPGIYNIISDGGVFAGSATGTITVRASPIPEPSTFISIGGGLALFGLAAWRGLRNRCSRKRLSHMPVKP
ncbi:MAG: hypothetical protein AAFX93_13970 [Verrucomicrobiota bacterium]